MKKTLNINIGNSIIHIEEDAYEMLTIYLNEVKQHFAKSADDFEIVTDIENRIAEMFVEILAGQQKQAVSIENVQSVIKQMGSVKDFETLDEPAEDYAAAPQFNPVRKLYRDTDQAMIAGVCIGLAHYLDVDVRWVRLITLLTILMAGAGIVAYIVLWIMVPKAQTRAEKMEMRGEETNLKGFANSYLQTFEKQSRGFIAGFFDVLGDFLNGTAKIIFKVIAIAIIFFGSVAFLSLIVLLAASFGFWDSEIYQYFPVNIINKEYLSALTLAVFIVFSIPLLALILFSVRVAFNSRAINKTLTFGLLIFWLAGIVVGIFYIAKITAEFKENAEFAQITELKPYKEYTLSVDRTRFFTKEDSLRYSIDPQNYKGRKILDDIDHNFKKPRNIRLIIVKSEDGTTSLSQNYKARGKTFEAALKNAQNIQYGFLQQGAMLNFSPALWFPKSTNWRNQEVELTIKIPVGTGIKINTELNRCLDGYSYWDCYSQEDNQFTEWVMTDTGLKCKHEPVKKNEK